MNPRIIIQTKSADAKAASNTFGMMASGRRRNLSKRRPAKKATAAKPDKTRMFSISAMWPNDQTRPQPLSLTLQCNPDNHISCHHRNRASSVDSVGPILGRKVQPLRYHRIVSPPSRWLIDHQWSSMPGNRSGGRQASSGDELRARVAACRHA